MLTIGHRNKVMLFDVVAEGISDQELDFWFRIFVEDISYGFKGELQEDGKVKVTVPPLPEIVNRINTSLVYEAN